MAIYPFNIVNGLLFLISHMHNLTPSLCAQSVRSRIHIKEDDEYLGHAAVLSPSWRAPARHPSAAFPVPAAGESRRWEQAPCNRGVLLRWCCRIDILQVSDLQSKYLSLHLISVAFLRSPELLGMCQPF